MRIELVLYKKLKYFPIYILWLLLLCIMNMASVVRGFYPKVFLNLNAMFLLVSIICLSNPIVKFCSYHIDCIITCKKNFVCDMIRSSYYINCIISFLFMLIGVFLFQNYRMFLMFWVFSITIMFYIALFANAYTTKSFNIFTIKQKLSDGVVVLFNSIVLILSSLFACIYDYIEKVNFVYWLILSFLFILFLFHKKVINIISKSFYDRRYKAVMGFMQSRI